MKSAGFHEIHRISWNLPNFMKSAGFHEIRRISPWNLPDFMKFAGFHHEIHWISWNSPDFTMKSTGFHHEICWISWIVDFAVFFCKTNTDIHERTRSTAECCIFFIRTKVLGMKSAEFHEICQISWNLPDFMKSTEFHEIRRISCISQMSQGPMVLFLYPIIQWVWIIIQWCQSLFIFILQPLVQWSLYLWE